LARAGAARLAHRLSFRDDRHLWWTAPIHAWIFGRVHTLRTPVQVWRRRWTATKPSGLRCSLCWSSVASSSRKYSSLKRQALLLLPPLNEIRCVFRQVLKKALMLLLTFPISIVSIILFHNYKWKLLNAPHPNACFAERNMCWLLRPATLYDVTSFPKNWTNRV
jgi:hypothetical protein